MLQGLPPILNHSAMYFIAQPILHHDGELFGHELLLRFKAYDNPLELLKIVRHLGLRHQLDLQVCEMAKNLIPSKADQGLWLINLYAESLSHSNTQLALHDLADQLAPCKLMLHILELELVQDMPHLRKAMVALHDSGIQFALDIEHLEHPYSQFLPFDLLRMTALPEHKTEWYRWIEAARTRGVPLLAFHVEEEDMVYALTQRRVDYLQGYAVRDNYVMEIPQIHL